MQQHTFRYRFRSDYRLATGHGIRFLILVMIRNGAFGMDKDCFSFVVYMIHACADRWNTAPSKVYRKIKESGCLDEYLIPCYDVLHTQSTDYVVQDISDYLKDRGIAV